MEMTVEELGQGRKKVVLEGALDTEGADKVGLSFSAVACSTSKLLLDMSRVDVLTSLGMRTLVLNAQVIARRGGVVVAMNPQPMIEMLLRRNGIDRMIQIHKDPKAAHLAVLA